MEGSPSASPSGRRPFKTPPFARYHRLVLQMARVCRSKLPPTTSYDVEDLYDEGWLVYERVSHRYDPSRAKFITVFWTSLRNMFGKILQAERRHRREPIMVFGEDGLEEDATLDSLAAPPPSQDRLKVGREAALAARALADDDSAYRRWERANFCKPAIRGRQLVRRLARWIGDDPDLLEEDILVAAGGALPSGERLRC